MSSRRIVGLLIGGLLCAASLDAQTLTGTILGVVRDASGATLPGVTATVSSTAMPGGPVSVTTTEQGQYRFTDLRPGEYELTITLDALRRYVERGLRVAEAYGGSNVGNARTAATEPVSSHGYSDSLRLNLPPLGFLLLKPAEAKRAG